MNYQLLTDKIIEEMLKLKLYPSYSIIILGIVSRIFIIFDYFNKNIISNILPSTSFPYS